MAYASVPQKLHDRAWKERFEQPRAAQLIQAAGDYERLKEAAEHVAELQRRSRQQASSIQSPAARRLYLLKAIDGQLLLKCKREAMASKSAFKAALSRYRTLTPKVSTCMGENRF
jgi:hypothetical protein